MRVKETIRTTRYDDNGRPVVTERTVYYDTITDRDHLFATREDWDGIHRSSLERVFEAYRDYCNTFNWD